MVEKEESLAKRKSIGESDDLGSGCFQVGFKSALKSLSHVVTFQSTLPLCTSEAAPTPIGYFEVKILNFECKEPN